MTMPKEFKNHEIAWANILSVLQIEGDYKNRGMSYDKLWSLFNFDKGVQKARLFECLFKKDLIKRDDFFIKITRKGKKWFFDFKKNSNKKSLKKYRSQVPIEYHTFSQVKIIQAFIGFLFLSIFLSICLIFNVYAIKFTGYSEHIHSLIAFFLFFLFFISFTFFFSAMWIIIIQGIGFVLEKLSFDFSYFVRENAERIAGWIILFLIIIGIIVTTCILGWLGLITSIFVGVLFEIVRGYNKIIEWLIKVKENNKK